jgi:hypothetical protein
MPWFPEFAGAAELARSQIRAGHHTLTAEDPLPPDLRDALALIK